MNESWQRKPEHPETGGQRLSPPVLISVGGTELEKRAAQVGKAAGTVVTIFRDAKRRLREPRQESTHEHLNALGEIARTRASELRHKAAEQAEVWRRAALEITAEMRRRAKTGYASAWDRARQTGRDYPLHVAIGAALLGFLIGAGLRIRRSHRAG